MAFHQATSLELSRYPFERMFLDHRVAAESREPVYALLSTEPGHLALGVPPRCLLNRRPRLIQLHFSRQYRSQLLVPDKIKRF